MMRSIFIVLCALLYASALAAAGEDSAPASVLVTTQAARQGVLDQPIEAYGTVQSSPSGSIAIAALRAAQVQQLRVVAGQAVARGAPLLDLASDPASALAYGQAQSDLDLARAELVRTRQMVADRLATASQLDQAAKAVRDAEATLRAREREGAPLETLSAPAAGIVAVLAVANGDHVQPGTTLLTLARSDAQAAQLGVSPEDRGRLKPGQAVQLIDLDAPAAPVPAKIETVGAMVDPKTGMVAVITTPADAGMLSPGAHLRARIAADGVQGWIVPRQAVLVDADGPYLFQIADGKATRIDVAIAGEAGDLLAVSGRLDPARTLVVEGSYQLSDGQAVREATPTGAGAGR